MKLSQNASGLRRFDSATVADAHGGLGVLSEIADLNQQSLYKMLSEDGNPTIESLVAVLNSLGIALSFSPKETLAA